MSNDEGAIPTGWYLREGGPAVQIISDRLGEVTWRDEDHADPVISNRQFVRLMLSNYHQVSFPALWSDVAKGAARAYARNRGYGTPRFRVDRERAEWTVHIHKISSEEAEALKMMLMEIAPICIGVIVSPELPGSHHPDAQP